MYRLQMEGRRGYNRLGFDNTYGAFMPTHICLWLSSYVSQEQPPPWHEACRPPDSRASASPSTSALRERAQALWNIEDSFFRASANPAVGLDWEDCLPFTFPRLASEYPRIALGRPKVIAFDLFGTLLVRWHLLTRLPVCNLTFFVSYRTGKARYAKR